jgi:membrane protease subunit HflK
MDGNEYTKAPPVEGKKSRTRLSTAIPARVREALVRMKSTGRRRFESNTQSGSVRDDLRKAFRHVNPGKSILILAAGLFSIYLMTGIYVVNPGEQAVIKRFGAVLDQPVGEGIHYRLPRPVDEVRKINVLEARRADVGLSLPEHMHEDDSPEAVELLTGDENIITLQAVVHYRVKDAAKFFHSVNADDESLVRNSIEAALVQVMAGRSVDGVLSIGKVEAQNNIVKRTQKILDSYDSGLQITVFNIQAIVPPGEVANAFRDVTAAREDKERQINQAMGYYNSVIPGARGKANQRVAQAEASSIEAVNTAKGEAGRFLAMLSEYRKNSDANAQDSTKYRLFLETFEKILPKAKKYIVDSANQNIDVTLIDPSLAGSLAKSPASPGNPLSGVR